MQLAGAVGATDGFEHSARAFCNELATRTGSTRVSLGWVKGNRIKVVAQRLRYTQQQQDDILAHFIQGADLSAGGIMQAVTSVARSIPDADAAYQLESTAARALRVAASVADLFAFDHPALELLYVKPGEGAWTWSSMDGRGLECMPLTLQRRRRGDAAPAVAACRQGLDF